MGATERRLLCALVVVVAMLVWLASAAYGRDSSARTVRVAPGDTLWSIAATHSDGGDVRPAVDAIIAANHLRGPAIFPGEELTVPDG